jgi:hypothetical protein
MAYSRRLGDENAAASVRDLRMSIISAAAPPIGSGRQTTQLQLNFFPLREV